VAVGRFVAPIAGQALSRGGTILAELISEWPSIAGLSLAAYTCPAKITKGPPEPAFTGKAPPAMLHLKVDPARALEVQYLVPQLIERINQTLGFKAVSGLRIVQAPVLQRPQKSAVRKPAVAVPPLHAAGGESRLSSALARMAAGVETRGLRG
jgi:hypothetical protein